MASLRWAYVRIISGTILGGVLGFYVMHRVETSYKERRKEEMKRYEMNRRQHEQQQAQTEFVESGFWSLIQPGKEGFFF